MSSNLVKYDFKPRSPEESRAIQLMKQIIPNEKGFLKVMLFCAKASTGRVVSDDVFFLFIDGSGSNGKSTFIKMIAGAMKGVVYAHNAQQAGPGIIMGRLDQVNITSFEVQDDTLTNNIIPDFMTLSHHTLRTRKPYSGYKYVNNITHHIIVSQKRREYNIEEGHPIPEDSALYVTFPTKFVPEPSEDNEVQKIDNVYISDYTITQAILHHYVFVLDNEFDGSVRKAIQMIDAL